MDFEIRPSRLLVLLQFFFPTQPFQSIRRNREASANRFFVSLPRNRENKQTFARVTVNLFRRWHYVAQWSSPHVANCHTLFKLTLWNATSLMGTVLRQNLALALCRRVELRYNLGYNTDILRWKEKSIYFFFRQWTSVSNGRKLNGTRFHLFRFFFRILFWRAAGIVSLSRKENWSRSINGPSRSSTTRLQSHNVEKWALKLACSERAIKMSECKSERGEQNLEPRAQTKDEERN